ncbi:tetratricopeptide repeat protein [Myceligenerans salitolerans]|uniref:Tetratricopeptide repeat protein n=1 Tax=Myceligenerans salitolerans TaxID=1230528 RepID=A0ABS3IC41_9MICO|nr:tetratricopeptide repeat protein [Myceligenerans salitolerans]MBO0610524.1 tetratricopeptide repeat protein [Myceligenerans salitolerans]
MDLSLPPHSTRAPRASAVRPPQAGEPGRPAAQRAEFRTLLHWARSRTPLAVCFLTGPRDSGKTRLAHDLAGRLARRGWAVLQLRNDDAARAALEHRARRRLLVVDDADTFPALRSLLLSAAGQDGGRTRVLLLARRTAVWRDRLEHGTPALHPLLCGSLVLELPAPEPAASVPGRPSDDPGPLTPARGAVLATAMLLGAQETGPTRRSEPPAAVGPPDEDLVARALADDPKFAARVTTGLTARQAVHAARLLARIMSAGPRDASARAVAGAYARVTAQLPDDADVLETFSCHPEYLTGDFMRARVRVARRAVTLLDGDRRRQAAVHVVLADALKNDGRYARALEAADQALRLLVALAGDGSRAGLESALAAAHASRGTLLWFRGRIDEALDDHEEAVAAYRDLVADRPARYRPELAQSMMNMGSTLAELGRAQEALAASAESVALARLTSGGAPAQVRLLLAKGLWNLGKRHAALGAVGDAYRCTLEAVETCRELVRHDPYRYNPDLASALSYLGARLSELGRPAEAARATAEALELRRRLAEQHEGYLPFVAQTLSNLGILNAQLGRRRLGLEREREAVTIRRRLATSNPDRYLPELAASLSNLGVTHSVLGNATQALAAEDEATGILRELAAAHPERHLSGLVKSLSNLASRLAENGRTPDAVDPAEEAVGASRRLTGRSGTQHLPVLATSLTNLAGTYADVGRHDDAVAAAEEAAEILDGLTRARPEKYEPELALALTNLAVALAGRGDLDTALGAARRAARLRARLADENPVRFREPAERSDELVRSLEAARADGGSGEASL